MTAEIAIMNKMAVALAADSAVTMGSKIYNSVNKLFMLSKHEPVGIMVYGNAGFMGVPWETIIKLYRDDLGNETKPSLNEYADEFIDFIITEFIGTEDDQRENFLNLVGNKFMKVWRALVVSEPEYLHIIFNKIEEKYGDKFSEADEDERQRILMNFIVEDKCRELTERVEKIWNKISKEDCNELYTKYKDLIEELFKIFEDFPLSEDSFEHLKKIAIYSFYESASGIVIAGFGTDEIFPSICSHNIAGVVNNNLKYKLNKDETEAIDKNSSACIIPFAQHEMVDAFLEGVTPTYHDESKKYLKKIFDDFPLRILEIIDGINDSVDKPTIDIVKDKIEEIKEEGTNLIEDYNKFMVGYKEDNLNDILDACRSLPKDEMASMAESLVHITSLKRKYTYGEVESVGGAIDVAVISKGDGFVWIKRKHYFNPELNHHFFKKYYSKLEK